MTSRAGTLGFSELIDLPVTLLRRPFRRLYPIALVGLIASGLPVLVTGTLNTLGGPSPSVGMLAATMLAALFSATVGVIAQLAVYAAVRSALDGEEPELGRAWREALRPTNLVVLFVVALVIIVGLCLCILPGLVLSLLLSFVYAVLVGEPERGLDALGRSYELVRFRAPGRRAMWVEVAGVLLVNVLLSQALQSIAQIPGAVLQIIHAMRQASSGAPSLGPSPGLAVIQVVTTLVSWVFVAVALIYSSGALTLMYRKAREVREGVELERAFQALAGAPATGSPPA